MNLLNYPHVAYMFINTHLTWLRTLCSMSKIRFVTTTWNARGSCVLLFMYSWTSYWLATGMSVSLCQLASFTIHARGIKFYDVFASGLVVGGTFIANWSLASNVYDSNYIALWVTLCRGIYSATGLESK